MTKEEYAVLLLDPRWEKKRQEIIYRDEGICQGCWLKNCLQVHHTKYINGLFPWEYDDEFLQTVCRECHESLHERLRLRKNVEKVRGSV